jgi:hypothetical protein
MNDRDGRGWGWVGSGAGIALVDGEYWEQAGQRAGVCDPYRAKVAFVCGAVREFLTAARLCYDAELYLGSTLLLMPPLELFGRCVTGDHAASRKDRIREGVGLVNQMQRGVVAALLDAEPIWKLRSFLAGAAVAMDLGNPANLDRGAIDQLGRGLALALDQYWTSRERRATFARTKLTALQAAGNPIYIAGMARHLANGQRPSEGLAWAPPA